MYEMLIMPIFRVCFYSHFCVSILQEDCYDDTDEDEEMMGCSFALGGPPPPPVMDGLAARNNGPGSPPGPHALEVAVAKVQCIPHGLVLCTCLMYILMALQFSPLYIPA